MRNDALNYVIEAIQRTLVGKEFEDVRDKKTYRYTGIAQTNPVKFEFDDIHSRVLFQTYYFGELKCLREVEPSQLEQATQSKEGEK